MLEHSNLSDKELEKNDVNIEFFDDLILNLIECEGKNETTEH
jgi:hypothetical protein